MVAPQTHAQPLSILTKSLFRIGAKYNDVFSMNGPHAFNYYHWWNDLIPMLRAYEALQDPSIPLILPDGLANWQVQSLELLGYPIGSYDAFEVAHARVRRLLIPSWHKPSLKEAPLSPSDIRWIASRVYAVARRHKRGPKRIFVSRADSLKPSRIANETDVSVVLERHGFSTVVLGKLCLDEQISLFANAEIVVGAHGAGLTNSMFSTAKIVELMPDRDDPSWFFVYLSSAVGVQHLVYWADRRSEDGRFFVETSLFERAIQRVLREEAGA